MALSPDTKDRLGIVVDAARFVFQWGFIPTVIYLGKNIITFMRRDFSWL